MSQDLLEAECKYRVENLEITRNRLHEMGATFLKYESHRDIYLRHPARDFRATDEALRIREVDGKPFITYKGPRLAGPIKIRPEIELPLVSDTVADWLKIWNNLSFVVALEVKKSRDSFEADFNNRKIVVTLDHVESLGDFVEIELILKDHSEVAAAQDDIQAIAQQLGLSQVEPRSYLGMLLAKITSAT